MKDLQITVEGPEAVEVAEKLALLIKDTFGHETTPTPRQAPPPEPGRRFDPAMVGAVAAIGAMALTIPGASLSVMDIADRLTKRALAKKFLNGADDIRIKHSSTTIRIKTDRDINVQIQNVNGDTLIDISTKTQS